jgi:hypothetical protein
LTPCCSACCYSCNSRLAVTPVTPAVAAAPPAWDADAAAAVAADEIIDPAIVAKQATVAAVVDQRAFYPKVDAEYGIQDNKDPLRYVDRRITTISLAYDPASNSSKREDLAFYDIGEEDPKNYTIPHEVWTALGYTTIGNATVAFVGNTLQLSVNDRAAAAAYGANTTYYKKNITSFPSMTGVGQGASLLTGNSDEFRGNPLKNAQIAALPIPNNVENAKLIRRLFLNKGAFGDTLVLVSAIQAVLRSVFDNKYANEEAALSKIFISTSDRLLAARAKVLGVGVVYEPSKIKEKALHFVFYIFSIPFT